MPSPTVCAVSGTCRDSGGNLLSGVTVRARQLHPYVHSVDNSLVMPYVVSTTSASDGTWSLSLIETATESKTVTIDFLYSTGSNLPNDIHSYTVTVPNSASATFASLISGEI